MKKRKKKMVKTLLRINHEQREEDESDVIDKMENIDFNEDPKTENLTPQQLKEFQRAVASGSLSQYIETWEPWWINPTSPGIKVIDYDERNTQEWNKIPEISTELVPLNNLTKTTHLSPLLKFHLVDLLFSYTFVMRLFNGDPSVDLLEFSFTVLQVSAIMPSNSSLDSLELILQRCIENSLQPSIGNSVDYSVAILQDVSKILSEKRLILAALSDLYKLFLETSNKIYEVKKKKDKRKIDLATKKIYFFLIWTNEQQEKDFELLKIGVLEEWKKQKEFIIVNQHKPSNIMNQKSDVKPLIQEIG